MTDERIIAYLLEELPEEESEQFEDECFAQESWPAQLSMVEGDLIDDYLRDELTPERRQNFERKYLTTEARQERVMIAAALLRHVDQHQAVAGAAVAASPVEMTWAERFHAFWSARPRTLRAATALGAVAILAGALWFSHFRASSPQSFATLTLSPSASNNRAEGIQTEKVKLPLSASALRISLTLSGELPPASRYRVEWENDKGEKRPLEIDGQDAQSISVVIPAALLARGQYALKLFAVKSDGTEQRINGSYFFTVE